MKKPHIVNMNIKWECSVYSLIFSVHLIMTTCGFVVGVVALPHPGKSIGPMAYEILNSNNVRAISLLYTLNKLFPLSETGDLI